MDKPRVAIVLDYSLGLDQWRERAAAGDALDATPYGLDAAADRFALVWARSHDETDLARRMRGRLARWLGCDVVHAWRNRRLIISADAVWTDTERQHLAVALLQRLRPRSRRVPVVAQSVWLWDEWPAYGQVRRAWVRWLLGAHAVEVCHSPGNVEASQREVPGRRVRFLRFGTSIPPHGERVDPVDVLSVGNDRCRDWQTLADALAQLPGVSARIVSSAPPARRVEWPDGVVVGAAPTRADLAALYRGARAIVVVSRANPYASGITAAIEALDAGKPLVVTDTGGIGAYVEGAADLVPPGDSAALGAAIKDALDGGGVTPEPGARAERGLTARDYVDRYAGLTGQLLAGSRKTLRERIEGRH